MDASRSPKLPDFSSLYCDEEGKHPVTQFISDVEYAGLVKFDFLGLRTLTIINWALEMINKRRAKNGEPPLDIAAIPWMTRKLRHAATLGNHGGIPA
ncbi:hypothetical protein ACLK19_01405 [Escherichia coli]